MSFICQIAGDENAVCFEAQPAISERIEMIKLRLINEGYRLVIRLRDQEIRDFFSEELQGRAVGEALVCFSNPSESCIENIFASTHDSQINSVERAKMLSILKLARKQFVERRPIEDIANQITAIWAVRRVTFVLPNAMFLGGSLGDNSDVAAQAQSSTRADSPSSTDPSYPSIG